MARKYSRDNRGRFAGAGGGATARGGRLKTAAGNKRETQKRIMFSPESKRLSGVSLDAAAKSGKINMPVRFGGEGAGYKTPRGKAAAAAATAANNAKRAEIRRAGLPKSGGAMRVKGGIKRDPGAAAKLASRAKPARAAAKAVKPAAPKAAKPAVRRKSVGTISEAKAGRIISRLDANRPGLRRASGSARKTANAIRTQQRATDFALAASARGRKQGKNLSVNQSLQRAIKNASAKPKTGQEVMKANVRKVQNQKLRKINAQIKEAGTNAAGLRLQKLQLQSNITSTRPKRTPRQEAKKQASVAAAKGRVATMRRVNRARANKDRTADTRNTPGSAMKRRPSQKTTRANNLADRALSFYSNPAKALQAVKKSRRGFRLPRGMR